MYHGTVQLYDTAGHSFPPRCMQCVIMLPRYRVLYRFVKNPSLDFILTYLLQQYKSK